jgi:gliding motility-associated-like protein
LSFSQQNKVQSFYVKFDSSSAQTLNLGASLETWSSDHSINAALTRFKAISLVKSFKLNMPEIKLIYTVEFSRATAEMIPYLEQLDGVVYAEPVPEYEMFHVPNDLHSNQWNLRKIFAENAWDIVKNASKVVVAVVDDAVQLTHSDLSPNAWVNPNEIVGNGIDDDGNGYIDDINGYDVSDNDNNPNPPPSASSSHFSHGTHCAGIVSAATNNGNGIASIGYNAKIVGVKCKPSSSSGASLPNALQGVAYAISIDPDIISMSWGGGSYSKTAQALFDAAHAKGIVLVAAAGNSNVSSPMYPAAYRHIISVAASDNSDKKASFSNYGKTIDVTAPGVGIWSTVPGSGQYDFKSGTSMACPLVAGLCALMVANVPNISPDSLEACLKRSCDNIDKENPSFKKQLGSGRINARAALECQSLEPIANFDVDSLACPGTGIQFFSNAAGKAPLLYKWTFPGGVPSSSSLQNPVVTYSSAGQYGASLEVSNTHGTDKITKSMIVTVQKPTAEIKGKFTIPYGQRVGCEINFTGAPPFEISVSDGSNTFVKKGITYSPYIFDYGPATQDVKIVLTAFSDANCQGNFKGEATIELLGDSCQNIVSNPGFVYADKSNCVTVGFSSDMKLDCTPKTNGQGYIHITDDGSIWNGVYWAGVKDHTPGGGTNFMLGDGASSKSKVWYQNIGVIKGKTYEFSAWFINANVNGRFSGGTSAFEMRVGGVSGQLIASTGTLGKKDPWEKHGGTYTATKTETVEITIVNVKTFSSGNDFAIDDVVFKCAGKEPGCFRSSFTTKSICVGDSVRLDIPQGDNYSWVPSADINNDSIRTPVVYPEKSRLYVAYSVDTGQCNRIDSFEIIVNSYPDLKVEKKILELCEGDTITLGVSGGTGYTWTPNYRINFRTTPSPIVFPTKDTTYYVEAGGPGGCASKDSVHVKVKVCCGSDARIDALNDSVICFGEKVQFKNVSKTKGPATFNWDFGPYGLPKSYIGETPPPVAFSQGGSHSVRLYLSDDCGKDTTEVVLHYIQVNAEAGPDSILCPNDSLQLGTYPISGKDYSWFQTTDLSDPLASNPIAYFKSTITYILTVQDQYSGCTAQDTVVLTQSDGPEFIFPNDTSLCQGEVLTIDLSQYPYDFVWQDGSKLKQYTTSSSEKFVRVRATNGNCAASDSFKISERLKPKTQLPSDTSTCIEDPLELRINSNNISHRWLPSNSTENTILAKANQWYRVELSNDCGITLDSVYVNDKNCNCLDFVPNVFTPNNDQLNEFFGPVVSCALGDVSFYIYNRWGEKIYESHDLNKPWDGKYLGSSVPDGVYFWIFEYKNLSRKVIEQEVLSGTVTVLR